MVAVVRSGRVIVPRGDTLVRIGDEVIVLVTDESEEEVRDILTGKLTLPAPTISSPAAACRPG